MKPEQLTIRQLLKDPAYRKWFGRQPKLHPVQKVAEGLGKSHWPWFVYVQRKEDGPWARALAPTYSQAYEFVKRQLQKGVFDLTIHSRRASYGPPPGFEVIQSHSWCPYCRRPTVFWWYRTHHALKKFKGFDLSEEPRCTICGLRENDNMVVAYSSGRMR